MALRMREGWQPPYPLIRAEFPEDVRRINIALIGAQSMQDGDIIPDARLLDEDIGPALIERAEFRDAAGYRNAYWICYWTDQDLFCRWEKNGKLVDWIDQPGRASGKIGYWLEVFSIDINDFETIFGTDNPDGVACAHARMAQNDKRHGYWGSMRDRIPNAATDGFVSKLGHSLKKNEPRDTFGRALRVIAPSNLCYIRSGQDYSHCGPDQRHTYLDDIQPVLKNGMDFLRDNPEETGCCTLRFSSLIERGKSESERTFGLGFFLSLGDLEDWSSTHMTHLMIFARWQQMYRKYDHKLELRTWHEVGIIRSEHASFTYVNCHPDTGLLPFFTVEEIGAAILEPGMA